MSTLFREILSLTLYKIHGIPGQFQKYFISYNLLKCMYEQHDAVCLDCPCVQLTEESVLKGACDDHQLCIISFLPNILDCQSECRNNYLTTLRTLGEKYKKRTWG